MTLSAGIVGLPNVGKSTLFNALTSSAKAQAANYPFCTIEPNVGIVELPDERLYKIAKLEKSRSIVPTFVEFVDIAGLVKGASKGEGLGNQFLSHIRQVDLIVEVLRCFLDENVTHVEGSVNPIRDLEIIDLELIAKDLESVQKRIEKVEKTAKSGNKEAKEELSHLTILKEVLENLKPIRSKTNEIPEETINYAIKNLFLLTAKPLLIAANIEEKDLDDPFKNPHYKKLYDYAKENNIEILPICAKLESELIDISKEEKEEILKAYGLKESGLNSLIKKAYYLLGLITFFTAGEKESRAWTITKGTTAQKAAGKIHSDIERGFIAAEVINYKDYIQIGSMTKAKEKGIVRLEGKNYIVQDGDIVYFRFNV